MDENGNCTVGCGFGWGCRGGLVWGVMGRDRKTCFSAWYTFNISMAFVRGRYSLIVYMYEEHVGTKV